MNPPNPPEFYEARDSVDSGSYKKESTRQLRKHHKVLSKRYHWESEPQCDTAHRKKLGMVKSLEDEIEKRGEKIKKSIFPTTVGVTAILASLLYILQFFGVIGIPNTESEKPQIEPENTHTVSTNAQLSSSSLIPPNKNLLNKRVEPTPLDAGRLIQTNKAESAHP